MIGLIMLGSVLNYLTRSTLAVAAPTFMKDLGMSEVEYSLILNAFQATIMLQPVCGFIIDTVGLKLAMILFASGWSVVTIAHGFATHWAGFAGLRALLGFAEGCANPAGMKATAEWFPAKERALATGIFNAGTNVGAIVTPFAVPMIAEHFGWRAAFVWTGLLSATWLVFWLMIYRPPQEHPKLSAAELEYIRHDQPPTPTVKIRWSELLTHRQTWAFALGKGMTDPIWWFYLFWLPKFLDARYGVKLADLLARVPALADVSGRPAPTPPVVGGNGEGH